MPNPNIVNTTSILSKTNVLTLSTTTQAILSSAISSGQVMKVNALYISNIDSSVNYAVDVDFLRYNVPYYIARSVTVPSKSTLDVLSKPIYLQEGDSLRLTSSAVSGLHAVCSYEQIS